MAHPYFHSKSSARKFGGTPEDYIEVHNFLDSTKSYVPDCRHRLVLHNSWGIFICEKIFGVVIKRQSDGKEVPTRLVAEQHIIEDMGFIPTLNQLVGAIPLESWMCKSARRLSKEFEQLEGEKEDELPTDNTATI